MITKFSTSNIFALQKSNSLKVMNEAVAKTYSIPVQYVVVAGGGAGGATYSGVYSYGGGGGGAGGYRSSAIGEMSGGGASAESILNVPMGSSHTVTIGAGGTTSDAWAGSWTNGVDSVFSTITSLGGGRGGGQLGGGGRPPGNGGSGGGQGGDSTGIGTGTAGQGFNGAYGGNYTTGGTGGGAGAAGTNGGSGGIGVPTSITGTPTYYAGGGGSQSYSGGTGGGGSNAGGAGGTNTGGGGGGRAQTNGGPGGSGIVIIAYPSTIPALTVGAGLTYDTPTRNGYRVYRFTAGTGTVTFP